MHPRGFWGTFLTLAVFTGLPFALVWAFLLSQQNGTSFGKEFVPGLMGGFFFGILFGLVMAGMLKSVTRTITITDKAAFISKANVAFAEIGYHLGSQSEGLRTFKPSLANGLLATRITVQVDDASATLVGPRHSIDKIIKKIDPSLKAPSHGGRWVLIGVIGFFALGCLVLLVGGAITHAGRTTQTAQTATPKAPVPAVAEPIIEVLSRSASITSVKFDIVTSNAKETTQGTITWKLNKVRMDLSQAGETMTMIYHTDNHTQVTYLPKQKIAESQQVPANLSILGNMSPSELAKAIAENNPVTLGIEPLNGRPCVLIQGTGENGYLYRAWIDRDHGLPLQIDSWRPDGKETTEFKNVEYFYIPDSAFELPSDVNMRVAPPATGTPTPKPTAKPTPSPLPVSVPRLYINQDYRYSIEMLEGWTLDDKEKGNVIIRSPDGAAYVQIFGHTGTVTLGAFLDSTITFRAKTPEYQEYSRTLGALPGNLPAYSVAAKWTNPGTTTLGRKLSLITVKTNRQIELICSTAESSWSKYSAQLEKMAYTFAMED